ncbi:MAG: pyridoxal phosphate-dependent aminotransferase family protein [Bacteroidales bacterium]|nr:pyridoxal phosphate-dependent aminotransferase family protein [Bacteroidales bacterium]
MKPLQEKLSRYTAPQDAKQAGIYPYFRAISSDQDAEVIIDGRKVLMLGSNSYLGLTNHPKIKEAAKAAIDKYGTGCAGSPFLNGTLDLHIEFENKLAEFFNKGGVMLYSTGFQTNVGVIPCVTGRNDYIIFDETDHASIIEGKRLSFANTLKFKHNDMNNLERVLQKCPIESAKLIVVDGVFSMEGDIVKLPELVEIANKYNASVMVDEAHGLGVLGSKGRGTCDHFDVVDNVDIIMGTFSKSLASIGGFVAADAETINWMKHNSRSYIFSASISPAATAAAMAAFDIMVSEPWRQDNLWKVTNHALNGFRQLGFEIGNTETPIIPLFVRDNEKTFTVTKMLLDEGVFVNPVISPAVAPDDTLIRISLMATHTTEQIDYAIDKIYKCFKRLEILK